jgi:DNA-binding NarL/FixJ family response regulator
MKAPNRPRRDEAANPERPPRRVALVAPRSVFRDSFAHVVASLIEDIRLECSDSVDDVAAGPARLGLIALDPGARREATREAIAALRARCGGAPIGVVASDERAAAAVGLGALGVAGLVSLGSGVAVAAAAIRLMSVGGYCLPPEALTPSDPCPATSEIQRDSQPSAWIAPGQRPREQRAPLAGDLTARECAVLRVLREGRQNKIIAFKLGISESTVKVHLRNIMKKLHASNRTQVALRAPLALERAGDAPRESAESGPASSRVVAIAGDSGARLPLSA